MMIMMMMVVVGGVELSDAIFGGNKRDADGRATPPPSRNSTLSTQWPQATLASIRWHCVIRDSLLRKSSVLVLRSYISFARLYISARCRPRLPLPGRATTDITEPPGGLSAPRPIVPYHPIPTSADERPSYSSDCLLSFTSSHLLSTSNMLSPGS